MDRARALSRLSQRTPTQVNNPRPRGGGKGTRKVAHRGQPTLYPLAAAPRAPFFRLLSPLHLLAPPPSTLVGNSTFPLSTLVGNWGLRTSLVCFAGGRVYSCWPPRLSAPPRGIPGTAHFGLSLLCCKNRGRALGPRTLLPYIS